MRKKTKVKIALGSTAAAILAVAAGVTLFFTKTKAGKEVTKKIKLQAVEISKKVGEKIEKAKILTQKKYEEIIDEIVDSYTKSKKIAKSQSKAIKQDLKSHWREVRKDLKNKTK